MNATPYPQQIQQEMDNDFAELNRQIDIKTGGKKYRKKTKRRNSKKRRTNKRKH